MAESHVYKVFACPSCGYVSNTNSAPGTSRCPMRVNHGGEIIRLESVELVPAARIEELERERDEWRAACREWARQILEASMESDDRGRLRAYDLIADGIHTDEAGPEPDAKGRERG